MAETWNNVARSRDVTTMELVEQILRGSGASSAGHQQRSMSSGRHPRLGASTSLQGQLLAAAGASAAGGNDPAPSNHGRSPRPRSASVGRRQQDMQELANVVQALQTKGRVIQSISSILQELPEGPTSLRPVGGAAGASVAAGPLPGGPVMGGGGHAGGSIPPSAAAVAPAVGVDGRAYGGGVASSSVVGGNAAGGGSVAGAPRSRGGGGGGSSSSVVAGKGVARSILGGVETLTSKLELLGDRLTPRKGSPRAERPRDSSNGRRHASSSGDGGGPNFRDLLAAANAGLLQGSRDQRPITGMPAAVAAGGVGIGVGVGGGGVGLGSQGVPAMYGAPGLRGAGASGSLYGGAAGAELAASMIMQNRHRTTEDLLAADRLLQNLHAEIRGASASTSGGGTAAVGAAPASAGEAPAPAIAPHPPAFVPPSQTGRSAAADHHSAAAGVAGGGGGNLGSTSGNQGSVGDAAGRTGGGSRRRGGSAAAGVEGGGMLQSFLATLSEAMPPPQTPMARSSHGPGADATPARPVEAAASPQRERANQQGRNQPHQSPRSKHLQGQQQQRSPHAGQHLLMRTSAPDFPAVLSGGGARALAGPAGADRSTAGGASTASMSGLELGAELEQRLSALQRTAAVTMARGVAALEPESSLGSAGVASAGGAAAGAAAGPGSMPPAAGAVNVEAWLQSIGRTDRRDRDREQRAAAAVPMPMTTSGPSMRDGALAGAAGPAGPQSARLRTAAWADELPPPAASGSTPVASTAGAVAAGGVGVLGTLPSYATVASAAAAFSARGEGRSGGDGSGSGSGSGGGAGVGSLRDMLPAGGYLSLGSTATAGQAAGPAAPPSSASTAWQEPDGLNLALLLQQRKKDRARREEQEAADAAAAASRARQHASDWQAQHDLLMTRYLAVRQRLEALEMEQERVAKEGCGNCARRRDQLQQVSDAAANAAAQLREVQAQLQEARAREEAVRRQLEHTATTASDQAAAGARQRTSFELALQEFLDLAEAAAAAASLPGMTPSCGSSVRGEGSASASVVGAGGRHHAGGADLEGLMEVLRSRLRDQGELARRQREVLEATQEKLAEERSAAAAAREAASSERAGSLALATQEAGFQRERAEALQEELARQRDVSAKLEMRVRQIEDERDRIVRQRDAAELSLQAQQAQLEAAQQQQETLVGRLYDGQRAREDAEVLQAQIRSLGRQLEEARATAARSEALERKVAAEREAREELDGQLAALQSQLAERESALEGARRRVRELEAAANSAVASRQVALDQVSSRADEVRTLTAENARMFHLLDRLQQEKRAADAQVQDLAAQLTGLQQEAANLRSDLSAARDQLAAAKTSNSVMDATLAHHQMAADLAAARSEAAALRTAHEAAGEYAQVMARMLRRHGLPVPEPPTAAEVASQIGALQAKVAAESDALAAARAEASELRQQLSDSRVEVERLKREVQSLTERYSQLEAAHAASQHSWQLAANRDAASLTDLSRERDALRLELHTLQVAGTQDGDEMRRKVARLEVQVEALGSSKREAEERARLLAADLGVLRKELADREAKMEAMKLSLEDAKEAAERAANLHQQADAQADEAAKARAAALAELDKARAAAVVEADKARVAALREVEKARAAALAEAEQARAAAQAEAEAALEAARAEAEKAVAEAEAERARAKRAAAAAAKKAQEEANKARAAGAAEAEQGRAAAASELEKQTAEVNRLQSEVERLEKELADRNAEYAGLYDYCAGVIGERDAAVEERESFTAASAAAAAEVAALRRELEELREELADKEQRLAVKPKMAELQYRINELSAQLAEVTAERDAAVTESNQTAQKLQDETEAHFQTDGRRVRLGEEVERLRGILRMYSIPF